MKFAWLIISGLVILGITALKWASKVMAMIMGLIFLALAVVGIMYVMNLGPFKTRSTTGVEGLKARFCTNEADQVKCDCIVRIIENDINERWSDEELKEMQDDNLEMLVIIKSFNASEDEIDRCLEEHDAKDQKAEFIQEALDQKGVVGKFKLMLEDLADDYKKIEEKYED